MKKLLRYAFIMAISLGVACEGPEGPEGPQGEPGTQGPQGPAGPQGQAGEDAQKATIIELSEWNFAENDDPATEGYENDTLGLPFSGLELEIAESDIVLVYRLTGGYMDNEQPVLIWNLLPSTVILDNGSLQYNFFHSYREIFISLYVQQGWESLSEEELEQYAQAQLFRIVVLPGDYLGSDNGRIHVDYENYYEVISAYNLSEKQVKRIEVK